MISIHCLLNEPSTSTHAALGPLHWWFLLPGCSSPNSLHSRIPPSLPSGTDSSTFPCLQLPTSFLAVLLLATYHHVTYFTYVICSLHSGPTSTEVLSVYSSPVSGIVLGTSLQSLSQRCCFPNLTVLSPWPFCLSLLLPVPLLTSRGL